MSVRPWPIALILTALAALPARAADPLPPELAIVPKDAAAFVSFRYDLFNKSPFGKSPVVGELLREPEFVTNLETKWLGFPLAEIERVTLVIPSLNTGGPDNGPPIVVVTRTGPIDRAATVRKLGARSMLERSRPDDERGPRPIRHGDLYELRGDGGLIFVGDRTMLFLNGRGAREGIFAMLGQLLDPSPDAPLGPALAAAARNKAVVAGVTGNMIQAVLGEEPGKGGQFATLGKARAVTLVADVETDFRLTVTADFPDEAAAQAGQTAAADLLKLVTDALARWATGPEKEDARLAELLAPALRGARGPKQAGKTVAMSIEIEKDEFQKTAAAALQLAVNRVREAAARMKSSNNLKQFGLAVHNYHDTYAYFPFKQKPKEAGHPGLSWRVHLLPYIEQDNLYRQFKLDEPWDSEHNKKLIALMPKIYAVPSKVEAKPGYTFYRMFDGPGTMSVMKSVANVTDGLSNTVVLVEAAEPVIWTKPDGLEFDPKKPLPKLGGHFSGGFNALFGDGSVRFIRKDLDEKVLRALITANGNEVVDVPDGR